MRKMSQFLEKYFWDVDFYSLDLQKNAYFIIERILEEGDINAIKWMLRTFSLTAIKKVLQTSKKLSRKSANF